MRAQKGDLALYEALETQAASDPNIVLSPFGVAQAFALAQLGARGDTARQIQATFGIAPGEDGARQLAAQRKAVLDSRDGVRVRVANALWLSREWRFRPDFVEAARRQHGARVTVLDYRSAADAATTINDWAREETEGLIPEIVGVRDIDPDTAAFLTNALFFDGQWTDPFFESETRPFLRANGESQPFHFMKRIGDYATAEHDGWRAIRLPYGASGRFVMDIMLPVARGPFAPSVRDAPVDALAARLQSPARKRLRLFLPRFEIDFRTDLLASLRASGLTLPFDPSLADLSGMAEPGQKRLFVDRAFHAAKLQVFEEGTKAAAVTALRVVPVSAPPPWDGLDFMVDQPFLFAIRDTGTDTLLFFGRVGDPQPYDPPRPSFDR